jgi:AcrR family transcriptional regulator
MTLTSGPFATAARQQNKSARTRARLMDAAVEVLARDGFEGASVNEIVRVADVANGTFYVHFRDKEEITVAVSARIISDLTDQIDQAMADLDDAVERFSFATRQFIEFACGLPQWGWMIIRCAPALRDTYQPMETHLFADLVRGRRQGRIPRDIDAFLVDTIFAMIMSALAARLRGAAGPEAGSRVSELVLNMLQVPPERAQAVAWKAVELREIDLPVLPKTRIPRPRAPVGDGGA